MMISRYEKLKDIARLVTGGTPSRKIREYYAETGIPWVKIENLDQGEVYETREYLSAEGAQKVAVVPKGAVLFSVAGTLGKIGTAGCSLATNQQIMSVIAEPDSGVLPKFLYYYLKFSREAVVGRAFRTELRRINKNQLQEIVVPIPSVEDQERMTALLNRAEEYLLVQNRKKEVMEKLEKSVEAYCAQRFNPLAERKLSSSLKQMQNCVENQVYQARRFQENLLELLFGKSEREKNARYFRQREFQKQSEESFSPQICRLLNEMSDFQKYLYMEFARQDDPQPVHTVFGRMKDRAGEFGHYHIQEALFTAEIFRELGLLSVEEEPVTQGADQEPVRDGNGDILKIGLWQTVRQR